MNTGPLKVLISNYQNMSLQCIVFSGLACSQHAIKLILVSYEADLRVDSNDSSPTCISCKTKKLFKLLLGSSQHEQSIIPPLILGPILSSARMVEALSLVPASLPENENMICNNNALMLYKNYAVLR